MIQLSNHRKDSKNKNAILTFKNFQTSNHNFQNESKFTLIDQILKAFTTTEQLRLLLKKRGKLCILKLKTLYADGLNQEFNGTKFIDTVIFPLNLGVDTIICRRNINLTTIELLKNAIYMRPNFQMANVTQEY